MSALTKNEIVTWLKDHRRDRQWLAKQCGVSVGTVNNWFSTGFSAAALAAIDKLMKLDEMAAAHADPSDDTGLILFSTAEFERLERARALVGNPPRRQFYRDAILQYLNEIEAG